MKESQFSLALCPSSYSSLSVSIKYTSCCIMSYLRYIGFRVSTMSKHFNTHLLYKTVQYTLYIKLSSFEMINGKYITNVDFGMTWSYTDMNTSLTGRVICYLFKMRLDKPQFNNNHFIILVLFV